MSTTMLQLLRAHRAGAIGVWAIISGATVAAWGVAVASAFSDAKPEVVATLWIATVYLAAMAGISWSTVVKAHATYRAHCDDAGNG